MSGAIPGLGGAMFGAAGIGGIDSFTKLMLHCDGADASTTFTDSSDSARTVTAGGDAQIDTAQSKFGGASALFDGAGDYLSLADSADWAMGTGNFTIDCWVWLNDLSVRRGVFGQWTFSGGDTGYRLQIETDGSAVITVSNAGVDNVQITSSAGAFTTGVWYHVALVRSGNSWNLYKDGTSIASTTDADTVSDYALGFYIGSIDAAVTYPMNGWIDEFRVSKGIARWTASFTPPTAPYY